MRFPQAKAKSLEDLDSRQLVLMAKGKLWEDIAEALGKVEEHRFYRHAAKGSYGKEREREIRQAMMDAVANELSE